jgi:hypothetical protein
MPTLPVLAALKNTIVYHMGSVAFGSFIIAVIQFVRWVHACTLLQPALMTQ